MTAQVRIGQVTATVVTANPQVRIGQVVASVTPTSTAQVRIGQVTATVTAAGSAPAYARRGNAWVPARMLARKSGAWTPVLPKIRQNGAWKQIAPPARSTTIPTADLPGWTLDFSEDFDRPAAIGQFGTVYGNDWRGYNNSPDTSGNGLYSPDLVLSTANSVLDYYVHTTSDGVHRVAAPLPLGKTTGQLYGRYEVRFKSDPIPGYKIAFLQWPVDQNWTTGAEIDLPEANLDGSTVSGFVHTPGNPSVNALAASSSVNATDGNWHNAVVEWTPAGVKLYLDRVLLGSTTVSPPHTMYWALQQETQLSGGAPSSSVSGHLQVDWVARWAYAPANVVPTVTSIAPTSGAAAGSFSVTATGTGFVAGTTVTMSGTTITPDVITSATSLTFTAPSHAAGTVLVSVTNANGTSNTATLTYATVGSSFSYGVTEPTATNSGLNVLGIPQSSLSIVTSDIAATTPGQTFDRLDVRAFVDMKATNDVFFTNCVIRGRPFTAGSPPFGALVNARHSGTGLLHFTNCLFLPSQPDVNLSVAAGEQMGKFDRCDLSLGSDLIDYWSGKQQPNVTGCYLHDYVFWANDPKHTNDASHPGWSHNDAIQCSGSTGGVIWGNSIHMYANPNYGDYSTLTGSFPNANWGGGITMTPTGKNITGLMVKQNWHYGGEAQCFMPYQSTGTFNTGNSWTVTGNRYTLSTHPYGGSSHQMCRWGSAMGPAVSDFTGNVYGSDAATIAAGKTPGSPVPTPALQGSLSSPSTSQYICAA